MKKLLITLLLCLSLGGCAAQAPTDIAATTLPMWQFTCRLTEGTDLTVTRLVTENVSCLHDYTLTVRQMQAIEAADVVILSGAGLEEFLADALGSAAVIDASEGIELLESGHHHHHEEEVHEEAHHHEHDPHIWLSPAHAMEQARNICAGLSARYPEYAADFEKNLAALLTDLQTLEDYGKAQLSDLRSREILTFHDGFAYLADAFGIEIVEAIEEESGAEASAKELIHLIEEVRLHDIRAIFVEENGSGSAASIIAAETGTELGTLSMAMSGDDYFEAMYANIDALKEALQ
ncbi:MAG: zinc ABC transporter substrate-binding protein [Oscillospiraceae bacterium]|nr:zinc ABC transporter substrate-binding protein [Oscillospiraceae bacterium]MBQ8801125.1 zinc ABC transporter substrate-binding protein [Clostridium sp.]